MNITKQQLSEFFMNILTEENFEQVNNSGRNHRRKNIYYITNEESREIEQEIISKCMQMMTTMDNRNYVNQILHGKASKPFIVYGLTVYSINKKLAFVALHRLLKQNNLSKPNTEDIPTSLI